MYETGWASNKPGYDFIIGVINTHKNKGPADLPFDLRGRRILTYALAPDADDITRRNVRKQLIDTVVTAIKDNMAAVAQKLSDENPIRPAPHDEQILSLWGAQVGSNRRFRLSNAFGKREEITIVGGARSYARVIPGSWAARVPNAMEVQQAKKKVEADHTRRSAGSYGTCEIGFVRYWFEAGSDNSSRSKGAAAIYLENYGEYWCINDGPLFEDTDGLFVNFAPLVRFWRRSTSDALDLFDELGGAKRRMIEVGVTGIDGAYMAVANRYRFGTPQSRKPYVRLMEQQPAWDSPKIASFLRRACDDLLLAFSQPRISDDAFQQLWEG